MAAQVRSLTNQARRERKSAKAFLAKDLGWENQEQPAAVTRSFAA